METKDSVVILLHGLARTSRSMKKLERVLRAKGFRVININYPSRSYPIEDLAKKVRAQIELEVKGVAKIHFITHSLGGILVRVIQRYDPLENLKRVVMLSPPNQGSEIVDRLGHLVLFRKINGPAGLQLGTSENGFISNLGSVNFELGVVTGDRSINWLLSTFIDGPNDGKVSVSRSQIEGMKAFKLVRCAHPFIMNNEVAIESAIQFIEIGKF